MQRYSVDSKRVQYSSTTNTLLSTYDYQSSHVRTGPDGRYRVVPTTETLTFRTKCKVPRVGCMLVGWGGNNGSTVTASVLANKMKLKWRTREGVQVCVGAPSMRTTCVVMQHVLHITHGAHAHAPLHCAMFLSACCKPQNEAASYIASLA